MTHSQETFYAVAAQVIPVLFLVTAIERRMVGRRSPKHFLSLVGELIWTAVVLMFMVVGEITAFHALIFNTTSYLLEDLTVLSLAVAGVNVLIEAFAANFEAIIERSENDRSGWVETVEKLRGPSFLIFGSALVAGILAYAHFAAHVV